MLPRIDAEERKLGRVDSSMLRAQGPENQLAPAIALNAVLSRTESVEPFASRIWRCLRSAKIRVTVSRDVPISCAISSCVSVIFKDGSRFRNSPFLELQSSSNFASFSPAERESPSERTP